MSNITTKIKWLYQFFGLKSLYATGPDAWLIILSRCTRMFAYGSTSLIMALFFSSLHFSDFYIGLFMTLTLLGDVLLSLLFTLIADSIGRRKILFCGSALMILSGIIFATCENYWVLLGAAILGVISAMGGDFGPFRAVEESTLSHLTSKDTRSDVLAWYITTSSLGSAVGTEVSGRVVQFLKNREGGTVRGAYHGVFWGYAAMGLLNMGLSLAMSSRCEVRNHDRKEEVGESGEENEILLDEMDDESSSPISDNNNRDSTTEFSKPIPTAKLETKKSMVAQISRPTLAIMYKLWFLLIVDSLADGMTGYSLTVYYLSQKFPSLGSSTLGDITSASYFLSSISTVFAGPLSNTIGLVNTMVFTHLPSSAAVLLFPVSSNIWITVALFFARTGLNNMDQAPRSAFIAAVVKDEERTAVMGITGMLRTLAAASGPTVTGLLAGNDRFWIAFVVAGSLRICKCYSKILSFAKRDLVDVG